MQYREPIFHDRQALRSVALETTASTTFVDVPGYTLTTKDLGQPASYSVNGPVIISASLNNTVATFRVIIDANPFGDELTVELRAKDVDIGYTFVGLADGLVAGQVVQVQFKTDQGTLSLREHGLLIDGVPTSRVVQ